MPANSLPSGTPPRPKPTRGLYCSDVVVCMPVCPFVCAADEMPGKLTADAAAEPRMTRPRKSRRLWGSVAVVSVFDILFSQRHYAALRRLALAAATPAFAVALGCRLATRRYH